LVSIRVDAGWQVFGFAGPGLVIAPASFQIKHLVLVLFDVLQSRGVLRGG
jgi:hypothetical protein